MRRIWLAVLPLCLLELGTGRAWAQTHPAVPAYNSLPGASYTVYLDFAGFTFDGFWGSGAKSPGTTPAYCVDGNPSTFNSQELANIQAVWTRVAEKYAPFDVNVTTVDPAIAAGKATDDATRRLFYDTKPFMMHTVIGGQGAWNGSGGGVSQVNVTRSSLPNSHGAHTDWVFSAQSPSNLQFVAEAAAHENGHGFGLEHQSDFSGTTLVREYSIGTGTGPGSKAPIMGNSYSAERGTWRVGTNLFHTSQNDANGIVSNTTMGPFVNDGVGHSLATATALPINATTHVINAATAKGIIVPASSTHPTPSGEANYVADFWSFTTGTANITLKANAGSERITPGVADPGATIDTTLRILDASGNVVASSGTASLSETITTLLTQGTYYAQVVSAADPTNSGYYDMGSYFLSGFLVAVPEPASLALLASGTVALAFVGWRRRSTGPRA